jgi:glutathione peroxidase-family protein
MASAPIPTPQEPAHRRYTVKTSYGSLRIVDLALLAFITMTGLLAFLNLAFRSQGPTSTMNSINNQHWFSLAAKQMDGTSLPIESLRGRIVLVVNVASRCGFTPQYKQLQELHDRYSARGLTILAFPCNQFGGQEPGEDNQILEFCSTNYGVTFPVMSKIQVNGPQADPIYVHLKKQSPGLLGSEAIKWNFTKFLVDQNGNVLTRYASTTSPSDIARDIEKLLPPAA